MLRTDARDRILRASGIIRFQVIVFLFIIILFLLWNHFVPAHSFLVARDFFDLTVYIATHVFFLLSISLFPLVVMEGRGVTKYSGDTSYDISAATTEFDDALIQRGIVTHEQALMAKGATAEQAQQLSQMKHGKDNAENNQAMRVVEHPTHTDEADSSKDEEEDSDDDELLDDDFLDRYRQQRIAQLKREHDDREQGLRYGEAIPISRTEWNREVNDDSEKVWVVVCLTSSDTERTGRVEQAVKQLARDVPTIKFVLIPSQSAIPNWPNDNLPSLFLYRHGKMQHDLLRLKRDLNTHQLEQILRQHGVFDNDE